MNSSFPRYVCRCLTSGEGIVSLVVHVSRYVCVCHISLSGEGNALYPVLSSFLLFTTTEMFVGW